MTDRMSSDDFRRKFGKSTKRDAHVGQAGTLWICKGVDSKLKHSGWHPRVPSECPVCGEPISTTNYGHATAKQAEEYERRQG